VAKDMVEHFRPAGSVLEPCKGAGVFMEFLPSDAEWCEITSRRDFFGWTKPVDWVVGNPPFSLMRKWFLHSYEVADNILYLIPAWKFFCSFGLISATRKFGGLRSIRFYGTGGSIGFPMGNAVGAFHVQKGYRGRTEFTFAQKPVGVMPI
jgi:hypothetical protein